MTKPREDGIVSIPYPDVLSPAFLHILPGGPIMHAGVDEKWESSCQKLLLLAILMNDPGRVAALELRNPCYVVVQSASRVQGSGVLGVAMERFTITCGELQNHAKCDFLRDQKTF